MAKRRKLGKRLRKGARRLVGSRMAREVLEDLISAALIAAAVKLRESGAARRAGKAAKAKASSAVERVEAAIAGKPARPARRKR